MTSGKHDKSEDKGPFTSDLEDDPGIGQSPGLFETGEDPDLIEGVNTSEGDTDNAADTSGGIDQSERARTNK